MFNLMKEKLNI